MVWPHSPSAAIGIVFLSHMLVLYPTLRANSQWLGPVVTHFETPRDEVWLTIDDGPAGDTHAILDLFDRHDVKATFFVKGVLAQRELIDAIVARGHTVANHSHTHPSGSFWCLPPGRIASEIDECNRALRAPAKWFRAPVGMKNPFVHPALERRGMRLIGWSARAFDAVLSDPAEIAARLAPRLAPGAIVLMHQGRPHSLRALEHAIVEIKRRGYTFVIPDDAQLRAA